MQRRVFLIYFITLLWVLPTEAFVNDIVIVRDGQAEAVIVVDQEAYETDRRLRNPLDHPLATRPPSFRKYPDRLTKFRERFVQDDEWNFNEPGSIYTAAETMVNMVRLSTGAELPILFQAPETGTVIYIGESEGTKRFDIDQEEMDRDGFEILFPDHRSIVILGPGKSGTEYGVYEFLERFLGVRWLMPGEVGLDVPELDEVVVSPEAIREEPAFWSRRMTADWQWQRPLRMHHRTDKSHNLWRLFWAEDYLESHPHFFPMDRAGNRMDRVPGYTRHTAASWQPCFSADGLVEEAVASITEYFELNPEATGYYPVFSLGINDGTNNFCHCPECEALISGETNIHGLSDQSDAYFQWASKVAEGVAEKYPHHHLVTLAYQHTFEPPKEPLHPNVVVVLCYDGLKLIDPETRRTIGGIIEEWNEKANILGWYDYLYGRSYLLPRVYSRHIGDYYRLLHENGVRVINSQAGLTLGEIPKYYAAQKLKWDPYQDVDALLEDYYLRIGGEESAPYLQTYFDFWEEFWTERILETEWARHFQPRGTFLPMRHSSRAPTYLLDVTDEEMVMLRELMENAVAKADPGNRRERVENLAKTFDYYETTRLLYQAAVHDSQDSAELTETIPLWIDAGLLRERLVEQEFPQIPGMEAVTYSPAEMPFLGVDQVVRLLWKHRDSITSSPELLDTVRGAVGKSGDRRLSDIVERIASFGDGVEVDEEALQQGLVLHLPFNERRGARALDTSGLGNDGRIEEPVWVADTPSGEGYSLGFGPDTRVEVPHAESLSIPDAITVSFWIKLNDLGTYGWRWMISKTSDRGHTANLGWLLSGDHQEQRPDYAGRIEPRANAGGSWGLIAPHTTIPAEQWFHIVGVYDREKGGQLYVDALEMSPTGTRGRGPLAVNEAPLVLRNGDGMFYDFRIYNRVLSAEEVAALYTIGRNPQ